MTSIMRTVTTTATALALTAMLSGCQTTKQGFNAERDADISETKIVLPAALYKLKGFKVKGAKILETGSYRREVVFFTGGHMRYDRYFLGGFKKTTKESFLKKVEKLYPGIVSKNGVKSEYFAIGQTYYISFTIPFEGETFSCFTMGGDYGPSIRLRGGRGTPGTTYGTYCEPGNVPNLEQIVVPWMSKITLR